MDAARAAVNSIVKENREQLDTIDRKLGIARTRMVEIALAGTPLVALAVIVSTVLALRAFRAQEKPVAARSRGDGKRRAAPSISRF